jgi:sarcosine oxidase subunit gamma
MRSPAARLRGAGLCVGELANSEKLMLQVKAPTAPVLNALNLALGLRLPATPNTSASGQHTVLWLGPCKWLIISSSPGGREINRRLEAALSGVTHLISDYGDARTGIEVSGPHARTVLARVCALDLHPNTFGTGRCAQTMIARAPLLLHQVADLPVFHLYVDRSLAAYVWAWLADAASEFIETTGQA